MDLLSRQIVSTHKLGLSSSNSSQSLRELNPSIFSYLTDGFPSPATLSFQDSTPLSDCSFFSEERALPFCPSTLPHPRFESQRMYCSAPLVLLRDPRGNYVRLDPSTTLPWWCGWESRIHFPLPTASLVVVCFSPFSFLPELSCFLRFTTVSPPSPFCLAPEMF